MSDEKPYIITYSNWLEFEGRILAFRKGELFDITTTPKHIPYVGYWNVNRKQLSKSKAKELIKNEPKSVDISYLQWYQQEQLNGVFNLGSISI
jgi:hypothetical protein